ncbi:MAG TPA: hypothetical protein VF119_03340, partial [Candidatus Limnocylindrales bacterium]
ALAKGDAVATLDEPLPTDAEPGSKVVIAWTLGMPDGGGGTVPLNSEGVFIRFTPRTGEPLEVMARQDREGHYRATVTVPEGGLGSPVFGLKGEACFAGGGCQRSDILFPLASETRVVAPDPVAGPVAPAPVAPAPVAPAPVAQQRAPAAVTAPTQTAPSPAAATVDLTALPLVALVGVAVAGLALFIRGRGRATAT